MVILIIISEHPEGITGYKLQEKYDFPRGTLIRTLTKFEDEELLNLREEEDEVRKKKYYSITRKGILHLEELKRKWGSQFAMISELIPPSKNVRIIFKEGMKFYLKKRIGECNNNEEAKELFTGIQSKIRTMLKRLKLREKNLQILQDEVNGILQKIGGGIDQTELKNLIEIAFNKIDPIGDDND